MNLKLHVATLLLPLPLWIQVPARLPATPQAEPDPKEACSIEGRVVDASTGEALRNASVTLRPASGASQAGRTSYATSTDKEGGFAVRGIAPGAYKLVAARAGYPEMEYGSRARGRPGTQLTLVPRQNMTGLEFRLLRGGVITGKVVDEYGDPVERASVQAMRFRFSGGERQLTTTNSASTDDQGNYRLFGLEPGRYFVRAASSISGSVDTGQSGSRAEYIYPPVYYPGTTDESAATQVEVIGGAELTGVGFTMTKARAFRVTAQVQNLTGVTGRMIASLRSAAAARNPTLYLPRFVVLEPKQSAFTIQGIAAGRYLLAVGMSEQGRSYAGSEEIDIGDRDLSDIIIQLLPGSEIQGEVRLDGSSQMDLSVIRVTVSGPSASALLIAGNAPVAFGTRSEGRVSEDGTFKLTDIYPDAANLSITGLPDGFYVKSAHLGSQEVLESGLNLAKGLGERLTIVVSGRAGTVTGSVTDADNKPVGGATVVLVPKSEKRREKNQFYKSAVSDQYGRFTIKNVDPGDYKAYAWEDIETGAWLDPELLKPLESKAEAVTVEPSGQYQLNLKPLPGS